MGDQFSEENMFEQGQVFKFFLMFLFIFFLFPFFLDLERLSDYILKRDRIEELMVQNQVILTEVNFKFLKAEKESV